MGGFQAQEWGTAARPPRFRSLAGGIRVERLSASSIGASATRSQGVVSCDSINKLFGCLVISFCFRILRGEPQGSEETERPDRDKCGSRLACHVVWNSLLGDMNRTDCGVGKCSAKTVLCLWKAIYSNFGGPAGVHLLDSLGSGRRQQRVQVWIAQAISWQLRKPSRYWIRAEKDKGHL